MSADQANLLTRDNLQEMTEQAVLQIPMNMIADVLPFTRFPAGAYTMQFKKSAIGEIKRGEDKFVGIDQILSVVTVHELMDVVSNKDVKGNPLPAPEVGAELPISSKLDGSLQFYATTWRPVAEGLGVGAGTIKDWVEKMAGATVFVVIGHQKDKENKVNEKGEPVYYMRVVSAKLA